MPPWTVRRQLWIDSFRVEHSGISTDMLLFSEVGMPLTQHYRVYKGGLAHALFRTDYLPRLRTLLPSSGGTDDPSVNVPGSTPTSAQRQHRVARPKRLFPESAGKTPILVEQNPSEMAGEAVIDCRPSILPVSIPLCHLSPKTISETRSCVEYQPLEESGGSIMNMNTNKISINRIVGFAWNDCGTDVEDELPSPTTSPVTTRAPAVTSEGPVDPYGRGENFDLDLAKVFCDVSVLPALVTPVVDSDLNARESAVNYAPAMVPDVENTSGEVPEASGGSWIPGFVPPPVVEASVDGSFMELLQETGIEPTSPLPLSPMPVDTSTSFEYTDTV